MARTILTVDDSTSMRQMVRATLQSAGYGVVEAADGQEALEFARANPVDLVISDVNMPRMDGITLVSELRAAACLPADAAAAADHRVEPGEEDGRQEAPAPPAGSSSPSIRRSCWPRSPGCFEHGMSELRRHSSLPRCSSWPQASSKSRCRIDQLAGGTLASSIAAFVRLGAELQAAQWRRRGARAGLRA